MFMSRIFSSQGRYSQPIENKRNDTTKAYRCFLDIMLNWPLWAAGGPSSHGSDSMGHRH